MHSFHMSHRLRRSRSGFSLLEILAVLVIIDILASAAALSVRGIMARARRNAVKGELATISSAIEQYASETGSIPTPAQGLDVLTKATASSAGHPYMENKPIDPWGHPYQYNIPGRDGKPYEVFSLGADGQEGGDDDIGTWDLVRQQADTQPK